MIKQNTALQIILFYFFKLIEKFVGNQKIQQSLFN